MNHDKLEVWSFWWSEARLLIAAIALFIGGVPPVAFLIALVPSMLGPLYVLLNIAWLISGFSAAYLLYRFFVKGKRVFGGKNTLDLAAFAVMIISGLNLGLAAIVGQNPGMSITTNYIVLIAVGLLYVASLIHLYRRHRAHGSLL